jgi:hypothetical protein
MPEKAGNPAHRQRNQRLQNQTKTKFLSEVARASGWSSDKSQAETLALPLL